MAAREFEGDTWITVREHGARVAAEIKHYDAELERLRQMMWEAYAILGFDTDGDRTYHATRDWPDGFLDACRQFRADYDAA